MAYAWILEKAEGPALLSLTRQTLPAACRPAGFEKRDVFRGGYLLSESEGKPDVVILASGSELALARDSAVELESSGVKVRVVSIPCLELFQAQPEEYQQQLVPDDGTLVVAIEAGRGESYRGLVGRRGLVWGINRFGASAPAEEVAQLLGFTPGAVVEHVLEALGSAL